MEVYSAFSLSPVSDTLSSLIDEEGRELCRIAGLVLEKSFRLADGRFLLVTTDDCPFEEGIHITLLRSDGQIDESLARVVPYQPAVVTGISSLADDSLEITISNQERLVVTVDFSGHRAPLQFSKCGFKSDRKLFEPRYLSVSPAQA
ncbi:hypothetical protein [Marinobacter xestospongiae]|uniref:Uncharacterized protein n=1 Tax=Marinobacter xestospongiae TaxID=994319 RepID=A0ABU3W347_9GAMM|nr:hypothetical protein [Marinobacter xestospongiae]MDV2080966.1 hypothetical protein [Marinobacter xestospongiae]